MNFERITQWAELSECKRYTVAASKVLGKFRFQAFRVVPGGMAELLGTEDEAESCRQLCRDHLAQSPTDPRSSTADQHAEKRVDTAEQDEVARSR
jgi:hypothetical protein